MIYNDYNDLNADACINNRECKLRYNLGVVIRDFNLFATGAIPAFGCT